MLRVDPGGDRAGTCQILQEESLSVSELLKREYEGLQEGRHVYIDPARLQGACIQEGQLQSLIGKALQAPGIAGGNPERTCSQGGLFFIRSRVQLSQDYSERRPHLMSDVPEEANTCVVDLLSEPQFLAKSRGLIVSPRLSPTAHHVSGGRTDGESDK